MASLLVAVIGVADSMGPASVMASFFLEAIDIYEDYKTNLRNKLEVSDKKRTLRL